MVFSSLLFVFQFLPIALLLYYISPKKLKNLTLFVVSLVFYSWGEVRYFPIMIATILVNYCSALGIEYYDKKLAATDADGDGGARKKYARLRKLVFLAAVVLSLGALFVFKYLGFFTENINSIFGASIPVAALTLPLGISFYTFQTLSYTIDVYRGKVEAEHDFIDLSAFVTLFPQLIAGPIVRYTDIHRELKERTVTAEALDSGMEDFILGLARKVLIANNVGALWTEVEALGFGSISSGLAWLGILAFTLQIYFDFSGYSQMAIGLGKMMGFNFPKNFDDPYISRSATEFWRRWHITLGSWFREYVYIPLGGSRCGKARTMLNLFIVWALTGFWHGASWNFVLWGLYFFVLLSIEKAGFLNFLNRHKVFSHIYALFVVVVGWALFAITDFSQLGVFLQRLFVPTALSHASSPVGALYYLRNYAVSLLVGCWFSTAAAGRLYAAVRKRRGLRNLLLIVLFLLCTAYLVDSTYNPFLYFRF
ncbi:MAG: MBOAT family O-acyltransferase [Oscillospiraceae bacterium]|nr:MBOAT family O-acyltransferase [Oscillospiraceae bacterium]